METSELPVPEASEEGIAPGSCIENEIDLTALELWRDASVPEGWEEPA